MFSIFRKKPREPWVMPESFYYVGEPVIDNGKIFYPVKFWMYTPPGLKVDAPVHQYFPTYAGANQCAKRLNIKLKTGDNKWEGGGDA